MNTKHWYRSKTLWANVLVMLGIILNSQFGIELDSELQASLVISILAFVNLILSGLCGGNFVPGNSKLEEELPPQTPTNKE